MWLDISTYGLYIAIRRLLLFKRSVSRTNTKSINKNQLKGIFGNTKKVTMDTLRKVS